VTTSPTSAADDRIAAAPLPTARTLRRRSNLVIQTWRFARINLRMLHIIRKDR
jgi:hypothetical protein